MMEKNFEKISADSKSREQERDAEAFTDRR